MSILQEAWAQGQPLLGNFSAVFFSEADSARPQVPGLLNLMEGPVAPGGRLLLGKEMWRL